MNTVIVNDQPDWMHSLPGYKNEAKLESKLRRKVKRSVKKSFDPSQPRDNAGRWTATGEDTLTKQIPDGIRADVLRAYRKEVGGGQRFEITGIIPDKGGGVDLQYSSWATPAVERKSEIVNADIGFPQERRYLEDTSIGDDYSPDIPESFAGLASDNTFYRGMSGAEFNGVMDKGQINSTGEMNLTSLQVGRTYFTENVRAARDYAGSSAPARFRPTFETPGYVVAVGGRRHEGGWDFDQYADAWGKRGETSADDIVGIMEVRLQREYPGEISFRDDGSRQSSAPPRQIYVYKDVTDNFITRKSNPNHGPDGRFTVSNDPGEARDWQGRWTRVGTIPGLVDWVKGQYKEKGEWSGYWTARQQREAVNESLKNFDKALNEHFSDAIITDVTYPENVYEPVMGFKYHYRPTPTVVERTEPDEWGGPPRKVWADTALDNNPDYADERTPMPAMEALNGKPGVAFRGISNEEMRNIIRTGRIHSDSSRNFTDQKGRTLMADKPHSAYSYAAGFAVEGDRPRFGKPGYLLAIDVSEQPHELNSVLEIDVSGDIPADKILAVEEIALHIQEDGKHFYRLDGTHFSGEDAGTSYKQRDVSQEVKSKIEQRAAARRADEHRKKVRDSVRS